ncbi:MAG TPA: beta-lactamase family protein [Candidatus Lachnoclostridium pullistercoris]|uniref:Beta-lactamase family protein n=1 Tax=Candidatus Lachnoclostridium pullistercoris TaxID=2838632 RepID=A0A9D2PA96_9FIRM|nr:beta-lactamase family protein [Candidatus Lachnoclostridium pullistercoris]
MKNELKRSAPAAQGVAAEYIIDFLNACEKADSEIHGIMIARNGQVIFEAYNAPYAADIPHIMHSFTKILTNTAVALAYADGLLALDDPLLKFFPEYEASANEYLRKCTIRSLITMRNGQERGIGGNEWRPLKTSWKEAYFKVPFDKEPGKTYMYSSGNSYILSYIVQQVEKKTCRELVQERVGKKIGLTDFPWMLSPEGVCSGGNGVSLTTEDMLRIGLLYLNKGNWNGEQLIPEEWVEYAMGYRDPLPPVDGLQYNFHWDHWADIWAARGMFGQTCGLVPSLNMVFAITAADDGYKAMRLFQREIVDRVKQEAPEGGKMEKEKENADPFEEILRQKGLRMTLKGKNVSVKDHLEPEKKDLFFAPEQNVDRVTAAELHFTDNGEVVYVMEDDRGRHEVTAGLDFWADGFTTMTGAYLHHQYEPERSRISAIAYWSGKNTLMMEWRFPEMAFFDHVRFVWEEDEIKVDRWVNMNSQDLRRPTLHLKIKEK